MSVKCGEWRVEQSCKLELFHETLIDNKSLDFESKVEIVLLHSPLLTLHSYKKGLVYVC